MNPITIPEGLTPAQQAIWQAALEVQGDDPTRSVSSAQIGQVIGRQPRSVRSAIRRMKQNGIDWLFSRTSEDLPPRKKRQTCRRGPVNLDLARKRERKLAILKKGYVKFRVYRSVRWYIVEWKVFLRRNAS